MLNPANRWRENLSFRGRSPPSTKSVPVQGRDAGRMRMAQVPVSRNLGTKIPSQLPQLGGRWGGDASPRVVASFFWGGAAQHWLTVAQAMALTDDWAVFVFWSCSPL